MIASLSQLVLPAVGPARPESDFHHPSTTMTFHFSSVPFPLPSSPVSRPDDAVEPSTSTTPSHGPPDGRRDSAHPGHGFLSPVSGQGFGWRSDHSPSTIAPPPSPRYRHPPRPSPERYPSFSSSSSPSSPSTSSSPSFPSSHPPFPPPGHAPSFVGPDGRSWVFVPVQPFYNPGQGPMMYPPPRFLGSPPVPQPPAFLPSPPSPNFPPPGHGLPFRPSGLVASASPPFASSPFATQHRPRPRPPPVATVRKPWHPAAPSLRSDHVLWAGNVPSDGTQEELWHFFTKGGGAGPDLGPNRGVLSIHLIARSNCEFSVSILKVFSFSLTVQLAAGCFVNYSSAEALQWAISTFNNAPLRPHVARAARLVCRVRRVHDDLKSVASVPRRHADTDSHLLAQLRCRGTTRKRSAHRLGARQAAGAGQGDRTDCSCGDGRVERQDHQSPSLDRLEL